MTTPFQTLIIEDQQLIIDNYTRALESISSGNRDINFNIIASKNCDDANSKIEYAIKKTTIDLVLLDIGLPPSKDLKMVSGDDLGIKLRGLFPKVKIIVITHLNNNYRLINILKTVKPDSLLLKSELDFQNLTESILNVINHVPYYSNSILKLLRQHISNDYNLDNIDRQLLYQLSLGTKTKDLPNMIPLSLPAIEKRKRKLNILFVFCQTVE
jgi:DNA-binding NarL/FixJ family response regulator